VDIKVSVTSLAGYSRKTWKFAKTTPPMQHLQFPYELDPKGKPPPDGPEQRTADLQLPSMRLCCSSNRCVPGRSVASPAPCSAPFLVDQFASAPHKAVELKFTTAGRIWGRLLLRRGTPRRV
jgi:hypothetical protein